MMMVAAKGTPRPRATYASMILQHGTLRPRPRRTSAPSISSKLSISTGSPRGFCFHFFKTVFIFFLVVLILYSLYTFFALYHEINKAEERERRDYPENLDALPYKYDQRKMVYFCLRIAANIVNFFGLIAAILENFWLVLGYAIFASSFLVVFCAIFPLIMFGSDWMIVHTAFAIWVKVLAFLYALTIHYSDKRIARRESIQKRLRFQRKPIVIKPQIYSTTNGPRYSQI